MKLKLREIRKSKGITQTFISEKLGFKSVSGYNAIELGKRRLDLVRAKKLAEILDVSLEELFFEDDLHESCKKSNTA